MLGIDYSAGRPTGRQVAAAGYGFVCRYLSYTAGKNITAGEYADMLANGIAVVLVWETTASRMLGGHQAGIDDARQADYMATRVGHPDTRPIYFACDWDATPAQQTPINAYLDGAASILGRGRVGMYGGYWPLSRALDADTARYGWQTKAWSGSNLDPRAGIVQRIGTVHVGGIACDVNEAHHPDYGQNPYLEEDSMPSAEDLWTWDGIPCRDGDESNNLWQARNALGTTVKQNRQLLAHVATLNQTVAGLANGDRVQVDTDAIVEGVLAGLDPDTLAAAIRDSLGHDIAREVLDALAAALNQDGEA